MEDNKDVEETQEGTEETEETTEVEVEGSEESEAETQEVVEEEEEKEQFVPKSRLDEVLENNKVLNKALELVERFQPKPIVEEEPEPDIDSDPKGYVAFREKKIKSEVQYAYGTLLEQIDDLKAMNTIPGYSDKNSEIKAKIEATRDDAARQQKYLSRQDAYDFLVAKGKIKAPEKKKPVIKKTATKIVHESGTSVSNKASSTKRETSVEKRLEGKTF